jgi:hydroxyacid-oxoacid transhydrogenase
MTAPPYQGSKPIADVWSAEALEFGGRHVRRAVADGDDVEVRGFMMLGATMAGVGFGSAGVHIPHSCAYPIASVEHEYQPPGVSGRSPVHPARALGDRDRAGRLRFTYDAMPSRQHNVAELLAGEPISDRTRFRTSCAS